MGIEDYSTTAANNNAAPPNGAPEQMAASAVNDVIRQVMASIRTWYEDAQWIDFGHTPTRVDDDTFTVATDLTAIYDVGRKVKMTGSATAYGTIASSSYSAPNTTVNLTASVVPATLSTVSTGILTGSNNALPTTASDVEDTFTITGSGFSGSAPTGTARYVKRGNQVTLFVPQISGTSSSTNFSLTGIPASITPVRAHSFAVPCTRDNGGDSNTSFVTVTTSNTITVSLSGGIASVTPWTNSGTKAVGIFTITYHLI